MNWTRASAAVTLAATTLAATACADTGPDRQRMPRDVSPGTSSAETSTDWLGWGTGLGGVLLVFAVAVWHGADDEVPAHRSSTGPAAAAAAARRSAHHAGAVAIVGPALAALAWAPVSGVGAALLVVMAASWAVAAGVFAHHFTVVERGADLADVRWQRAAAEAERAGLPVPPEPVIDMADLRRLGDSRGFERPDGSAAAVMLDVAGRPGPLKATWARVAQAQGLGTKNESGTFTSWARIDEVRVEDGGDVTVFWRLTEFGKTAGSLSSCKAILVHELRVTDMPGGFLTEHATGRVYARFTTGTSAPTTKSERPAQPPKPPTDDDLFRW